MIASNRNQDRLEQVAEQYRADGYDVLIRPGPSELPEFLRRFEIDLIARKDGESVAVAVRRRGEFGDEMQLAYLAGDVNARPGWRFDLLVVSDTPLGDAVPKEVSELDADRIQRLADRAEQLLDQGHLDAACLIGWSALEASLREAARRLLIPLEEQDPQSVLNSLYVEGVFTRDEYDALQAAFRVRNAVAHGLNSAGLTPATSRFLVETARRILAVELSEITA
ncbi:MAG TPA: hypothetical protein VML55_15815 [Planctomycetaceae bacterium]|nr:hypothetical protein [Planctomycetaceae bacterium]